MLFLTRFRVYKIASPPQTKMTSKDDIQGLVSLSSFVHGVYQHPPHSLHLFSLSTVYLFPTPYTHHIHVLFLFKNAIKNTSKKENDVKTCSILRALEIYLSRGRNEYNLFFDIGCYPHKSLSYIQSYKTKIKRQYTVRSFLHLLPSISPIQSPNF